MSVLPQFFRRTGRWLAGFSIVILASRTFAQAPTPAPTSNATNRLTVQLNAWALAVAPSGTLRPANLPNTRNTFIAPCDVHISAYIAMQPPPHDGDIVTIDFYSNGEKLGTRKSEWMPELNPSAHRHGNEVVPLFIRPAQFSQPNLVWTNPPPGRYELTAKATFATNSPVTSSPLIINVLPPATQTNRPP
jgi:hypothetical protein